MPVEPTPKSLLDQLQALILPPNPSQTSYFPNFSKLQRLFQLYAPAPISSYCRQLSPSNQQEFIFFFVLYQELRHLPRQQIIQMLVRGQGIGIGRDIVGIAQEGLIEVLGQIIRQRGSQLGNQSMLDFNEVEVYEGSLLFSTHQL